MDKELTKWEKQRAAKMKREAKMLAEGKVVVETLNTGDVVLVKFQGHFPYRGMKVLEIEDGFIAGFYLDFVDEKIPRDTPEIEGHRYTDQGKWTKIWVKDGDDIPAKYDWDGKTFKKTRTYETKMIKFVKEKVENPVIIK
jgi:hypothetical protein